MPSLCPNRPGPGAPGATHADSLAVLHRVFHHDRRSGCLGTFLFAGAATTGIASVADRAKDLGSFRTSAQSIEAAAYAGLVAVNIVQWARFSQRREALAVRQFEKGRPLPAYVQQRFKKIFAREIARQHRF